MIRFYFDFISPNAWLAWARIGPIAARHGRTVLPVPVLFAALLKASSRPGPAEVPALWRWMYGNVLRKGALHGIPVMPPPSHPFNPLIALRVASLPMQESERTTVIDALFRAVWAGGPGVEKEEVVSEVLTGAGLDGQGLVEHARTQEAKDRLRRQTEEAIAAGAFGVPTMIVDRELFWGHDDLEFLDRFLAGKDPLPRGETAGWEGLRATAWRKDAPPR